MYVLHQLVFSSLSSTATQTKCKQSGSVMRRPSQIFACGMKIQQLLILTRATHCGADTEKLR